MSDRVVLDAATLDELAERGTSSNPATGRFVDVTPADRDALVAAARENAALREALTGLLAKDSSKHGNLPSAPGSCWQCHSPWPCPAERARLLLAGDQ